jgi:hypothetical protein
MLFSGDTEDDCINDENQLGDDTGFGVFWAATGFRILQRLVRDRHEALDHMRIINDKREELTIEDFLDLIASRQIRIPK